jgi:hypothetical protein
MQDEVGQREVGQDAGMAWRDAAKSSKRECNDKGSDE